MVGALNDVQTDIICAGRHHDYFAALFCAQRDDEYAEKRWRAP